MSYRGDRITATRVGECSSCHQMIVMVHGRFGYDVPVHNNQADVRCNGSGMSPWRTLYRIDTPEQALNMAEMIANDTEMCLDSLTGASRHTLACGDGNRCAGERDRRSKALAQYFLQTFCSADEDTELIA